MRGFSNPDMASCFINAPLLAILGPYVAFLENVIVNPNREAVQYFKNGMDYEKNNFYNALIQKDLTYEHFIDNKGTSAMCAGSDTYRDFLYAQKLQKHLRNIYDSLRLSKGKSSCENLRNLFQGCSKLQDMFEGQHDAEEFYQKLLDIFNYYPMMTNDITDFAQGETKDYYTCSKKAVVMADAQKKADLRLMMRDVPRGKWRHYDPKLTGEVVGEGMKASFSFYKPFAMKLDPPRIPNCIGKIVDANWIPLNADEIPTAYYYTERTFFIAADVVVIAIDRDPNDGRRVEVEESLDIYTMVPLTNYQDYGEFQQKFAQFPLSRMEDVKKEVKDAKDKKQIRIEKQYLLLSAVIEERTSSQSGHFTTLLRVPASDRAAESDEEYDVSAYESSAYESSQKRHKTEADVRTAGISTQWLWYNDLEAKPKCLTQKDAFRLMSRQARMLFYFPVSPVKRTTKTN
jgi:hypothetical protein